jgi:acyl-[acyl-carrier-protein]-phospholipid O-acyltransferase/long-chain-fatty-acid--[acyl-carrier-protein] ligase
MQVSSEPVPPSESDSATLQRGFWSLMATQFQNAFSDNALKNLVILLLLAQPRSAEQQASLVAFAGALFAAPFILFSMLGGWLADRFSKKRVMVGVKIAEIGIMLFAAVGLGIQSVPLQLVAIFIMGCHSAIFGPSKYGILPEILPVEKLSWANGVVELLTFLGIISGTVAGGFLAAGFVASPAISGLLLAALACGGWWCARGVPEVAAANPTCPLRINPVSDLWRQTVRMRSDRDLWRANWGNAGFYFVAALVQMNLVLYGQGVLHLSETQNGLLNAALAIGIGVGSVVAGYASRGRIEYGFVVVGGLVMALATFPMGLAEISVKAFCGALVGLGFGGGLFIVPIAAVLQHRPKAHEKGAVQGAASVWSFVGILGASGAQLLLGNVAQLGVGQIFWAAGAVALATGAYVAWTRSGELFRR